MDNTQDVYAANLPHRRGYPLHSTTQDVYAANLPYRRGYPLHSPGPRDELGEPYRTEGFQIGDVGYIDSEGEFNPLLNICDTLPPELLERGFPQHKPVNLGDPDRKHYALLPGHIFMTGVTQKTEGLSSGVDYEFVANSDAGAILILPSGATLFKLPQEEYHLETFQEFAREYAYQWCECSRHSTLYLITSMYKTCNFTLTSFSTGHLGGKMLVKPGAGTPKWTCAFEAYSRTSPPNNPYENQTILIQGFRMTVRWGWLLVVERLTDSQPYIDSLIASFTATLVAFIGVLFKMTPYERDAVKRHASPIQAIPSTTTTSNPSTLDCQVQTWDSSRPQIRRRLQTDHTTKKIIT